MEKEAAVVQCTCGNKLALARSDQAAVLGIVEPCQCSAIRLDHFQVRCSLCHEVLTEQTLPPDVVRDNVSATIRATPCRKCAVTMTKKALNDVLNDLAETSATEHGLDCECPGCVVFMKMAEGIRAREFVGHCYDLSCEDPAREECEHCHRKSCLLHVRCADSVKAADREAAPKLCDDCRQRVVGHH